MKEGGEKEERILDGMSRRKETHSHIHKERGKDRDGDSIIEGCLEFGWEKES